MSHDRHVTGTLTPVLLVLLALLGSLRCVHRCFLSNVRARNAGCANPGTPASWGKAVRFAKMEYAHQQVRAYAPACPGPWGIWHILLAVLHQLEKGSSQMMALPALGCHPINANTRF